MIRLILVPHDRNLARYAHTFIERKEFERVGDSKTRRANVRVIAATNVDMHEKSRQGLV